MGKSKSKTVYTPAAQAPAPAQEVPSQALQTQTALNEVSGAQQRLNMTLGSELDQRNKSYFTNEDIRQTQAIGGETRTTLATQGEQERLGYQTQGEQQRLGYQTQGEQQRLGTQTSGEEQRKTNQKQYEQENYLKNKGHEWAQSSYRA
jgi:hypothetical protein